MKQVIAIIRPYLAEKLLHRLERAPVEAIQVREAKGYSRQKNYLDEYRDTEFSLAFLPKVEVVMWVDDLRVEEIVRLVVEVPYYKPTARAGAASTIEGVAGGFVTDVAVPTFRGYLEDLR